MNYQARNCYLHHLSESEAHDDLSIFAILEGTNLDEILIGFDLEDDKIVGRGGNDFIQGLRGSDSLFGDGDFDIINGSPSPTGNDTLYGNEGNDFLQGGYGEDMSYGGNGNDFIYMLGVGEDYADGGSGLDAMTFEAWDRFSSDAPKWSQHVVVDRFSTGTALYVNGSLVAINCEAFNLKGGHGNDWISASSRDDNLSGGSGEDTLFGQEGSDVLIGEAGDDILNGNAGFDRLFGGAGNDIYGVDSVRDFIHEELGFGIDQINSKVSFILPSNVENLSLAGILSISGKGNEASNRIIGNSASNVLYGYGNADVLRASAGNDILIGGVGRDTVAGGLGNDVFQFFSFSEGGDVITDFASAIGNNDIFRVSATGFQGGLTPSTVLQVSQFQSRADNVAQDANDRFIFRTTDNSLWFDSNGSASGGLALLADLSLDTFVTANDILIY